MAHRCACAWRAEGRATWIRSQAFGTGTGRRDRTVCPRPAAPGSQDAALVLKSFPVFRPVPVPVPGPGRSGGRCAGGSEVGVAAIAGVGAARCAMRGAPGQVGRVRGDAVVRDTAAEASLHRAGQGRLDAGVGDAAPEDVIRRAGLCSRAYVLVSGLVCVLAFAALSSTLNRTCKIPSLASVNGFLAQHPQGADRVRIRAPARCAGRPRDSGKTSVATLA